jgi:hypothetical protein
MVTLLGQHTLKTHKDIRASRTRQRLPRLLSLAIMHVLPMIGPIQRADFWRCTSGVRADGQVAMKA